MLLYSPDVMEAENRAFMQSIQKLAKQKQVKGEAVYGAKLTERKVLEIRARYTGWPSIKPLAAEFGVSALACYNVIKRKTWKHI